VAERIAIVGSRDWPDAERVRAYVRALPAGTRVVSGGARWVDTLAAEAARDFGMSLEVFPADWNRHGRKAGPIRNSEIVAACDRMVAFWTGNSSGTYDAIRKARAAGKPVEVVTP
jgi:hypothetical protein